MKIKLVFDSTIDYTPEELKENNIEATPFIVMYDDKSFLDCVDITPEDFYIILESGKETTTSQPNVANTISLFNKILEEYDHIIYCCLPSELSGTYNAGVLAASEVDESKITVIDTKTGLGANRSLAKLVNKMVDENAPLDEIVSKCHALKNNSHAFFVPYDTKGLQKSGRFSNMAASIFSMIKLKLALELTKGGYIDKFAISRTDNKLYKEMVKKVREEGYTENNSKVYLIDTNNPEKLAEVKERLVEDFPGIEIESMFLSPTLGAHIGAKTYSVQFVRKEW